MNQREQYRTTLEVAIRRLHVAGFTNFYVSSDRVTLSDSNVMAWIAEEPAAIGLPDADLVVQDDEGQVVRAYLVVSGNLAALDHSARTRLQMLREQLERRGAVEALRILTSSTRPSVPDAIPAEQLPPNLRGVQIETISFQPAELVFDYLRMSKHNIFNSSNTPVAPSLIAAALGLPEAEIIAACEELQSTRRLELLRVGDRKFYRIP